MRIEYEAKFLDVDKDDIRKKLKNIGAKLIKPEFFQKRYNLHLPGNLKHDKAWLRVRDEKDKITLSLKKIEGCEIHHQKELEIKVDDFETAVSILKNIGCEIRMYQETKRELWMLGTVEVTIDEWPFLEPFIEIEAGSESEVKVASDKLGFDYSEAIFGPVGKVYKMKYGVGPSVFEGENQRLTFDDDNPYDKLK